MSQYRVKCFCLEFCPWSSTPLFSSLAPRWTEVWWSKGLSEKWRYRRYSSTQVEVSLMVTKMRYFFLIRFFCLIIPNLELNLWKDYNSLVVRALLTIIALHGQFSYLDIFGWIFSQKRKTKYWSLKCFSWKFLKITGDLLKNPAVDGTDFRIVERKKVKRKLTRAENVKVLINLIRSFIAFKNIVEFNL